MATVLQQEAIATLERLRDLNLESGSKLAAAIAAEMPEWDRDATSDVGYTDEPDLERMVICSRALHGALPPPFPLLPFKVEEKHGFGVVDLYLMNAAVSQAQVAGMLNAAIARVHAEQADE